METYRKINQWHSHSRDMVESFKRFYHNSFLDKQRQEAYNLFLGNYTFIQGEPMLWDLSTDYYLHHADPRTLSAKRPKSYIKWFTPKNLEGLNMPEWTQPQGLVAGKPLSFFDEYWTEYYRPLFYSTFKKMFVHNMANTYDYMPIKFTKKGEYDLSPFRIRDGNEHGSPEKEHQKKEVTIADPEKYVTDDQAAPTLRKISRIKHGALPGWLHSPHNEQNSTQDGIIGGSLSQVKDSELPPAKPSKERKTPKEKAAAAQWTLNQFVTNSLNPSVGDEMAHEYQRYINHPLNLPLVVSAEIPPNPNLEFLSYVNSLSVDAVMNMHSTEDDLTDYAEYLEVGEEPLTVTEADFAKKRYKAYRQWVKGKSLFKHRVDS
jgi:hypothetical protein